jgi:hypothetical protein
MLRVFKPVKHPGSLEARQTPITPTQVGPPRPPPPGFESEDAVAPRLHSLLASHAEAPFTLQRLCEVLLEPRKQYNRLDKLVRVLGREGGGFQGLSCRAVKRASCTLTVQCTRGRPVHSLYSYTGVSATHCHILMPTSVPGARRRRWKSCSWSRALACPTHPASCRHCPAWQCWPV